LGSGLVFKDYLQTPYYHHLGSGLIFAKLLINLLGLSLGVWANIHKTTYKHPMVITWVMGWHSQNYLQNSLNYHLGSRLVFTKLLTNILRSSLRFRADIFKNTQTSIDHYLGFKTGTTKGNQLPVSATRWQHGSQICFGTVI
jgi:hypothetical protein